MCSYGPDLLGYKKKMRSYYDFFLLPHKDVLFNPAGSAPVIILLYFLIAHLIESIHTNNYTRNSSSSSEN